MRAVAIKAVECNLYNRPEGDRVERSYGTSSENGADFREFVDEYENFYGVAITAINLEALAEGLLA